MTGHFAQNERWLRCLTNKAIILIQQTKQDRCTRSINRTGSLLNQKTRARPLYYIRVMKPILFILSFLSIPALYSQQYQTMQIALDTMFHSDALGYEKHIQLTVPTTYSKKNKNTYPLIIVFDMQNSINYKYVVNTVDYLSGFGQIPECLVIGIKAADRSGRYQETQLTENDEDALGDANEGYLFNELIPFLQNSYGANDQVMLFGHSRFGYYTTHLLTQRPNDLLGVISVSPFYYQENTDHVERLANMLKEVELKHDLYYIPSVGDTLTDTDDFYAMEASLSGMTLPEKFKFQPLTHDAADHIVTPGLTIAEGLYTIFRDWSILEMKFHRTARQDLVVFHKELQKEIGTAYGAPMPFSLGIYNGTGWRFYNDGQYRPALQCWQLMMEYYPVFSYGWVFIADTLVKLERPNEIEMYLKKAEDSLENNVYLTQEEIDEIKNDIRVLRK